MFGSHDPAARHQSRIFGTISAMFCLGACSGGLATSYLGNRALVIVVIIFFAVFAMCRPRRQK